VTDILNVSIIILNPAGLSGRTVFANVYVKNYRRDNWITGASINCTQNGENVSNIIDNNNGTYSINFTAPDSEGSFTLLCNATKNGNFGNSTAEFTTEAATTFVNMTTDPQNISISHITLYSNESFSVTVNISNIGLGATYHTNVTLQAGSFSSNVSIFYCNNITKNNYCVSYFNITIPNATLPGNYSINFTTTWTDPVGSLSMNSTQMNITVLPNPVIYIYEANVSSVAADGVSTHLGNFTIFSTGNSPAENISLSCTSGTVCSDFSVAFYPGNISSLDINLNYSVDVNVSVPLNYKIGRASCRERV
jgi:hypothetical protein